MFCMFSGLGRGRIKLTLSVFFELCAPCTCNFVHVMAAECPDLQVAASVADLAMLVPLDGLY